MMAPSGTDTSSSSPAGSDNQLSIDYLHEYRVRMCIRLLSSHALTYFSNPSSSSRAAAYVQALPPGTISTPLH
jgi:hypothetical protein